MDTRTVLEGIVQAFEIGGVAVLVAGALLAMLAAAQAVARGERRGAYEIARHDLGRSMLLGLEILIVADIVATITIDLSLESAATLGIIVLVRTFLSFSLDIELDGRVPWRRADSRSQG
jgi:uncharacterized membrane protein